MALTFTLQLQHFLAAKNVQYVKIIDKAGERFFFYLLTEKNDKSRRSPLLLRETGSEQKCRQQKKIPNTG